MFSTWTLRTLLHEIAAAINMPTCTPSDSGDLTAANGAFIPPACRYKCELMQVAAVKLANDFASGGSSETNVLQLNATPRTHFEYQLICEEEKCVAKQSRRARNNHSAAAAAAITQRNLNSERKTLPCGLQMLLQTRLARILHCRDSTVFAVGSALVQSYSLRICMDAYGELLTAPSADGSARQCLRNVQVESMKKNIFNVAHCPQFSHVNRTLHNNRIACGSSHVKRVGVLWRNPCLRRAETSDSEQHRKELVHFEKKGNNGYNLQDRKAITQIVLLVNRPATSKQQISYM